MCTLKHGYTFVTTFIGLFGSDERERLIRYKHIVANYTFILCNHALCLVVLIFIEALAECVAKTIAIYSTISYSICVLCVFIDDLLVFCSFRVFRSDSFEFKLRTQLCQGIPLVDHCDIRQT